MTLFDTSFNPMPSSIDPVEFKKLYIQIISDKQSDPTEFISYIQPFLEEVSNAILSKNQEYYFYYFLLKNIESFTNETALDRWLAEKTLKEDLNFILLKRLRNIKTIPSQAKPVMSQFYFVTDFRLAISNFIKKHYKTNKNLYLSETIDYSYNEPNVIDTGNNWYDYLLTMLSLGYSVTEISSLTGYSRTTIYKELKKYAHYKKTSD
jgi:hypothetical protein